MTLSKVTGFTLIELMIAVVIIGILTAIAYPSYLKFMVQSNRTDGQIPLTKLAAAQEKYYSECGHYAKVIVASGSLQVCGTATSNYTDDALPFNLSTEKVLYTVSLLHNAACAATVATCYQLQGVPVATKSQNADGTLTIDSLGNRRRTVGTTVYNWSDK